MAAYVVMKAPQDHGGADPEGTVLVRDGFAFLAFFLPVVWLLWHRLWIEALIAFAITVGLAALGNTTGFAVAGPLLSLLVSLYAGLEGAALRVAALRRRGWSEAGVVEADSKDDAETRWFFEKEALADGDPHRIVTPPVTAPHRTPQPSPGLLLNPGRS